VRANVFVGPAPDENLDGSAELTKVQRSAQNALTFLHELALAHLWLCCQVCLLLQGQGSLVVLDTAPDTRKRYDLHFFVGHINWTHVSHMRLFAPPYVFVDMRHTEFKVRGAARVQCCLVERVDTAQVSSLVLKCVENTATQLPDTLLHGMPAVQDLWRVLRASHQHAWQTTPASKAALAAYTGPNQLGASILWTCSGGKLLGAAGTGLATPRVGGARTTELAVHLYAVLSAKDKPPGMWKEAQTLLAAYYDATCFAIHAAVFKDMKWIANGPEHHDFLKDLKRLKAESRRDVSVLQSRTQTASLSELGMTHELSINQQSQAGNLNNMCLLSLHETLPSIDPVLMLYIDSFHAPNVALFLRLIRCTNLMALEHLAKTHDTATCKDELQRHLLLFPVGTAADIDYIMQYTVSNPRNVHSLSLKTTADPKAVQSSNVEHSLQYAWVQTLLAEIATTSTRPLHAKLQDSPLWQKLLLCHKPLYALLQSVKIAAPANDDPQNAVTTPDDLRTMHKRIIGGLMLNDIMYYVASVDHHVQIKYSDYLESDRDPHTDDAEYTEPVEDIHDGDQVRAATQLEHDSHKRTWPLQFTRMTWPLRDLNVFTRISLPNVFTVPMESTLCIPIITHLPPAAECTVKNRACSTSCAIYKRGVTVPGSVETQPSTTTRRIHASLQSPCPQTSCVSTSICDMHLPTCTCCLLVRFRLSVRIQCRPRNPWWRGGGRC